MTSSWKASYNTNKRIERPANKMEVIRLRVSEISLRESWVPSCGYLWICFWRLSRSGVLSRKNSQTWEKRVWLIVCIIRHLLKHSLDVRLNWTRQMSENTFFFFFYGFLTFVIWSIHRWSEVCVTLFWKTYLEWRRDQISHWVSIITYLIMNSWKVKSVCGWHVLTTHPS